MSPLIQCSAITLPAIFFFINIELAVLFFHFAVINHDTTVNLFIYFQSLLGLQGSIFSWLDIVKGDLIRLSVLSY